MSSSKSLPVGGDARARGRGAILMMVIIVMDWKNVECYPSVPRFTTLVLAGCEGNNLMLGCVPTGLEKATNSITTEEFW